MQSNLKVIIMGSLLATLFGCKGQTNKTEKEGVFPAEQFSIIQAKMSDGRPIVGSINRAYKNYDKRNQYSWCLKLAIGLNVDSCFENGLPKENEGKIANKLEDELV